MLTLAATVVVLGVLILVHELGHFVAAKLVGIEVVRFSIGLGPVLWSAELGETEYALSAIPLGGYVKMGGLEEMEVVEGGREEEREPGPRDFDAKPLWARTLVISAGVIMNMVFAFVVLGAEAGVWGIQEVAATRVARVNVSALPDGAESLRELEPGTRIATVAGREVGHWGELREAVLDARTGPVDVRTDGGETLGIRVPADREDRIRILRALTPWHDPVVQEVNTGTPADRGGLEPGDVVLAVNGREVRTWYDFVDLVQAHPEERISLTVERRGQRIQRVVTPDSRQVTDPVTGETRTVGRIGVLSFPDYVRIPVGPLEAVRLGWNETVGMTALILDFLRDLIVGDVSPRSVGSIVAIGEMSGQMARQGLDAFLRFMAFFSVNLAILNLLPIPILDGGHLLFIGIEAVRGRALSVEQRIRLSHLGFIIVVGLMLWALANDFLRLLGL